MIASPYAKLPTARQNLLSIGSTGGIFSESMVEDDPTPELKLFCQRREHNVAQEKPQLNITPARAKEFIETLDNLAKEKPAGFAAYIATCMSAMKMMDFTETQKPSAT